jgi:siderophore synthetase component
LTDYCTALEVIRLTGVKPSSLKLDKEADPDLALETLITDWIQQSMALIDSYCHRTFTVDETTSWNVVRSVCQRMTANMVALSQARRDTPLVKVNDWRVEISSAGIFTKELKDDLEPYIHTSSKVSGSIDFSAITGEDEEEDED